MQHATLEEDGPKPMHIFDIRRSNSVTGLWKKFEYTPQSYIAQGTEVAGTEQRSDDEASPVLETDAADANGQLNSAAAGPSEPLLAAFEAELARILNVPGPSSSQGEAQGGYPLLAVPQSQTDSGSPQNPADAFAQAVRNMVNGAQLISSGVRSRIPDFERQLRDIQQAVPGHVENTMQSAFTLMESRVRNLTEALHNAAAATGQGSDDLLRETPMAATTVNSLRTMASELGQMGHTLFTAFESELGYNPSRTQEQRTGEDSYESHQLEAQTQPASAIESPVNASSSVPEMQGTRPTDLSEDEKECLGSNKVKDVRSDDNSKAPNDNENSGASTQTQQIDHSQPPTSYQDGYRQHPGFGVHHHPPIGPLHRMPAPHGPFHYHRPYPPPSMPLPSFSSSPWQPHPIHPWSHFPPHPPRPHPHNPHAWRPVWPRPVHRPHIPHHARRLDRDEPTADPSNASQNGPASETRQAANKTLFVGNVGFNVTEKMIQSVFESQGFLVDVHLPVQSETGKHAGFGYLYFASIHAAKGALEALQGIHIDGHSINLEFSDHSPITNVRTSHNDEQSASQSDSASRKAGKLPEARELIDTSTEATTGSLADNTLRPASSVPGANNPSNSRTEIPGLLDRDTEDSGFSARYPSLVPEASPRLSRTGKFTSGRFPRLSPESQMDRFPPVSQLDAHMMANQRPEEGHREGDANMYSLLNPNKSEIQERNPQTLGHTGRGHQRRCDPQLRRSTSMMSPQLSPSARPETNSAFTDLRRRATELNRRASTDLRREAGRRAWQPVPSEGSRSGRFGSLPGTQHQDLSSNNNADYPSTINRIDKCVEALVSLGYGSSEEGGHHRLGVYAAAADGKVNDAIEMIEDERKAYAQWS